MSDSSNSNSNNDSTVAAPAAAAATTTTTRASVSVAEACEQWLKLLSIKLLPLTRESFEEGSKRFPKGKHQLGLEMLCDLIINKWKFGEFEQDMAFYEEQIEGLSKIIQNLLYARVVQLVNLRMIQQARSRGEFILPSPVVFYREYMRLAAQRALAKQPLTADILDQALTRAIPVNEVLREYLHATPTEAYTKFAVKLERRIDEPPVYDENHEVPTVIPHRVRFDDKGRSKPPTSADLDAIRRESINLGADAPAAPQPPQEEQFTNEFNSASVQTASEAALVEEKEDNNNNNNNPDPLPPLPSSDAPNPEPVQPWPSEEEQQQQQQKKKKKGADADKNATAAADLPMPLDWV
jgi:hypothetical protein